MISDTHVAKNSSGSGDDNSSNDGERGRDTHDNRIEGLEGL